VPQPTCSYIPKKDYVAYVGGPDATLVAEHTYAAAEYLMRVHEGESTRLDTGFTGDVPETVTYHMRCHLRAQNIGFKSRDLMKLIVEQKVRAVVQNARPPAHPRRPHVDPAGSLWPRPGRLDDRPPRLRRARSGDRR
jgi:Fe-S oxidoreductase